LKVFAESFSLPKIDNEELAAIVYTSGTTGFSKGVILQHNSLAANIIYAHINMPLKPGDSILSFMPLAHTYGCAFEFLFPFTLGCHITFLNKTPSPKIIVKAFQKIKPQLILSVPLIIEKIYKKQILPQLNREPVKTLSKIPVLKNVIKKTIKKKLMEAFGNNFHEIVVGGAALNNKVEAFLADIKFPFTIGYGMTECGPLISYASHKIHRLQSVGRVVNTMEVEIDYEDPKNQAGEILVRGENVMKGYYKNESATNSAIDKDGWLHTGDMGLLDEDGFIYIKGRCKNMILGPSGQNIYPEEIEARLNNMPLVQEALVIEHNQNLKALIYPDIDIIDAHSIDNEKLKQIMEQNRKKINQQLPVYSRIKHIELYPEEFEKTPTKKIKRFLYTITSKE
ncbi:MAG: AMP-binding protein, partial [Candidatus Cloacimonadota bacterium]|nr:AMP-binding protein [Candidatus Cloacimonadota bacterium]